jgi:hypothetical protein
MSGLVLVHRVEHIDLAPYMVSCSPVFIDLLVVVIAVLFFAFLQLMNALLSAEFDLFFIGCRMSS